jgi:UDP-glucose 4-epimerase
MLALTTPNIGGEVFQIATNKEHTVLEIAEILNSLSQKHLGYASTIVYEEGRRGEVKRNFSDTSKAEQLLDFRPRVGLDEGLEKTFLTFASRL